MTVTTREPFSLTITGSAEIPHPAERARFNITVTSTGANKASVSDEVITTAQHIESLLEEYAPADSSEGAKLAAPLAHRSKTSLTTSSYTPYLSREKAPKPRQHTATIRLDVRFRLPSGAAATGAFGAKLSALPHVQIGGLDWMLTAATERSFRSGLRRAAAQDALAKAQDYCDVFGCSNLRPVQLDEGRAYWAGRGGAMAGGMGGSNPSVSYQQMQSPYSAQRGHVQPGGGGGASEPGTDARSDSSLDFKPQELRMNMEVTVKFHADPLSGPQIPAKRIRSDDEEMIDH